MSTAPSFADVARALRSLGDDDLESLTHVAFRASGSSSRWARRDWVVMAGVLSRLEDRLELERPRYGRAPIRDLRRALEDAAELGA